jgi:hypothetical protein
MDDERDKIARTLKKFFTFVPASQVGELVKCNNVFALDLRDGTDFEIDDYHANNLEVLIESGDFLFGIEKV